MRRHPRFPPSTQAGDWHDVAGHHRYYGSSATNGGERIVENRRGPRPDWSISAASDSPHYLRASPSPESRIKLVKSMTAVVAAKLLFLFLPFLLSLFGKGGNGKDALSGDEHPGRAAERQRSTAPCMPWVAGMLISGVSVWERIRLRRMA